MLFSFSQFPVLYHANSTCGDKVRLFTLEGNIWCLIVQVWGGALSPMVRENGGYLSQQEQLQHKAFS